MADETWRILISDDAGGGGGAAGGGGGGIQGDDTDLPPAQKHFFENAAANFNLWKPFITVGGLLYTMYKSSSVVSSNTKGMWDILKAIMDVVLLPLQPIFTKIFEAIAPLVPKIAELSKAFLDPIVDWIMPILENFLNWALDIDWKEQIAKWKEHGEKLVGHLESIWSWVADKAWPKLTEWWDAIKKIWEGDDSFLTKLSKSWSVIWTDIKPMAEEAWADISKSMKQYWDETIWPIIEEAWEEAKDFWDETLFPIVEEFWKDDVLPMLTNFWNDQVHPIIRDFWDNLSRIAAMVWDVIVLKATDVWDDISWAFNSYILTPVAKSWEVITNAIGATWKSITDYVTDAWLYITKTLVPNMLDKLGAGALIALGGPLVGGIKWLVDTLMGTAQKRKDENPPPVFRDPSGMGTIGREMDKIWNIGGYREPEWLGSWQTNKVPTYMDKTIEEGIQRKEARAIRNTTINFENYGPIIGADDSAMIAFWQEIEDRILSVLNAQVVDSSEPSHPRNDLG